MGKERLQTRLGFILLSAGCAIGIGNVWRFPYLTGLYGGGTFVFFYLIFLAIMGIPIMSMEFSVGRASRMSAVKSFTVLERKGQKWHWHGYLSLIGNYVLMMFYTTVTGWMVHYFYLTAKGEFNGLTTDQVSSYFDQMISSPKVMTLWMCLVVVLGFFVISLGLQNGVEKITKNLMLLLLIILFILVIHSAFLDNAKQGYMFYLYPDFERMKQVGIGATVVAAMQQSFFTLSIGMGSMAIFGSYIGNDHTLPGESVHIAFLDTVVAILSGLIIFPACFAFNIEPGAGPKLIFITLPNIFNHMVAGRVWGSLFFIFLSFAAFSTVIAVFENISACTRDLTHWSRKKTAIVNCILMIVLSLPCVLGFNVLSHITPFGPGSTILDFEDFLVSNLILPLGSLIYLLFCITRYGWGFEAFLQEANKGQGIKIPKSSRFYLTYILPIILIFVFGVGIYEKFFS